jgi:hypothetical protein
MESDGCVRRQVREEEEEEKKPASLITPILTTARTT